MSQPGLRERKKQATRDALRLAALRLAGLHGWGQVRVEDIAAEAGVSVRTFSNYFATKEEALLATGHQRAERIIQALAARPAGEPLWAALTEAIVAGFVVDESDMRQMVLLQSAPLLTDEHLKTYAVIESGVATAVASRIGADADRDLYPRLVAGAVLSAIRVTMEHWRQSGAAQPLAAVLRDALGQVAAGLPIRAELGR
ncbi:TetR family transcriptional regulator [Actinoplanes sp. L3-i22]|uniref:acyl-CoA-like ligand-binding transcription factor n=1 Tax=Actinoplanes sp. L3-i22 TaxID=2836373 RepID=UPI001C77C85E|nr:TetR family transcriptional regulator [Actinoplanes sp. L3-i22]BCY11584.1 TetR family transcriptional regulator [Actinoplanes sp. L3-i22]